MYGLILICTKCKVAVNSNLTARNISIEYQQGQMPPWHALQLVLWKVEWGLGRLDSAEMSKIFSFIRVFFACGVQGANWYQHVWTFVAASTCHW